MTPTPLPHPPAPRPAAALHELADVLATYRTCELATVTRTGSAVAWPAVAWFDRAAGALVLTTSIALPRKALNVRRDPRVALLFSDPTGSGRQDLPQVLVQGTAECPEEIRTSPQGLEDYWRALWRHQPSSAAYGSTPLDRWLFDFYYLRLVLRVTPTAVTTRPPLVRTVPLTAARPARGDRSPGAEVSRGLPTYHDAVLATVVADAPPVLRRVRPRPEPDGATLRLEGADPDEVAGATSANLLLHAHDDQLGRLRQLALVGALTTGVEGTEGTRLRPTRLLRTDANATSPLGLARTVHRLRGNARRYLERRGLDRPRVPWAEYRALRDGQG